MTWRPTFFLFFFNDTATTEIYTLSLHDALPISPSLLIENASDSLNSLPHAEVAHYELIVRFFIIRSEEHTSELQSQSNLVCRLLLEKKKKKTINQTISTDINEPQSTTRTDLHPA